MLSLPQRRKNWFDCRILTMVVFLSYLPKPNMFVRAYATTRTSLSSLSLFQTNKHQHQQSVCRNHLVKKNAFGRLHYNHNQYHSQHHRLLFSSSRSDTETTNDISSVIDVNLELNQKIQQKGDEIRQYKAEGMSKIDLQPHIDELKLLKSQLVVPDAVVTEKPTESNNNNQSKLKEQPKSPNNNKKQKGAAADEVVISESEYRLNRIAKIEAMKQAGIEPFEYTFNRTTTAEQLLMQYSSTIVLQPGEEDSATIENNVRIAGRIMTRRVFGKLAFFTVQDETGIIQIQFDTNRLGNSFAVRTFVY